MELIVLMMKNAENALIFRYAMEDVLWKGLKIRCMTDIMKYVLREKII